MLFLSVHKKHLYNAHEYYNIKTLMYIKVLFHVHHNETLLKWEKKKQTNKQKKTVKEESETWPFVVIICQLT